MKLWLINSRLHVSHLMLNLQQGHNDLQSVTDSFIMFIKFVLTQQLLKSADLLRESGFVANTWLGIILYAEFTRRTQ